MFRGININRFNPEEHEGSMKIMRFAEICLASALAALCAGCGGRSSSDCVVTGIGISPDPASADHLAAPPGNNVPFLAFNITAGNCPLAPTQPRQDVIWSVSDPLNVSIGNTAGVDYGVATCKAAASGVTVTATGAIDSGIIAKGSASLTCK